MKKLLLTLGIVGLGFASKAQIIFQVEEPAPIAGFYDFEAAGSGWGLASLSGIYVLDTVKVYNDGVSTGVNAQGNPVSANGCNTAPAGSLAGKIALVFRGDGTANANNGACEFGLKAYNAQQAGAVAVIIVNREEQVAGMAAGANGGTVTIPVIMVGLSTGQAILNSIGGGDDVVAFIGDKTGLFDNDLSVFDNSSFRADFGSFPLALAQDATELSVPIGAWVYNYGALDQTGATLTATVDHGTEVYNEVSAPFALDAGDSVYVTFSDFSMPTYTTGEYIINYDLALTVADDAAVDNVVTSNFFLTDSTYSYARLDGMGDVAKDGFYRSSTLPTGEFQSCILFRDPNASRLRTDGLWYGGITVGVADTSTIHIEDQLIEGYIFEWDDTWTSAADATYTALNSVAQGDVAFLPGMEEQTVFIPFDDMFQFQDNQNYLACIVSYTNEIYHAMDTKSIYDFNIAENNIPRFPIKTGPDAANYNPNGFGIAGSIVINVGTDLTVAENTLESTAYPNPSKDVVTVKVNASGKGTLKVTDMAGRTVSTQEITVEGGKFTTNVAGMNAGSYVFNIDFANGTATHFNVVVTK